MPGTSVRLASKQSFNRVPIGPRVLSRGSVDNATLPKAPVYYSADSPYSLADQFLFLYNCQRMTRIPRIRHSHLASQGGYFGPCWPPGIVRSMEARPEFRTAGGSESMEPRMNANGRESNRSSSLASIRVHSWFCKLCDSDNEHPGRVAAER
jgi:hypothetical protein